MPVFQYLPTDSVYDEIMGNGEKHKYATTEECYKLVLLLYHLLKSYLKVTDLKVIKLCMEDNRNENGDLKNETLREEKVLESQCNSDKLFSVTEKGLVVINNNSVIQEPERVKRAASVASGVQSFTAENIQAVKDDLQVLADLRNHVRGFETHMSKIAQDGNIKMFKGKIMMMKLLTA